jgi:23S rRNA pseudouridine2605 synthase
MLQRVQKIISAAGVTSRRKAEDLIIAGRVLVNGNKIKIGDKADPEADKISVDGQIIKVNKKKAYYALNKPKEYVVTKSDPEGRKTIFDLESVKTITEKVLSVGRLDMMTEGLIILTDDGDVANRLTHPRYAIEKVYYLRIEPQFIHSDIKILDDGIPIDKVKATAKVKVLRPNEIIVTVKEGRNRIVRRLMESLDYKIFCLRRIRVGPINLGELAKGQIRKLTDIEVENLKEIF